MAIDKELLKEIKSAQTPRHFAFVVGRARTALKLSRNPITGTALEKVKSDAEGTTSHEGKAIMEEAKEGDRLVFFMKGQPDKTLEPKLKRAIKESAGLNLAVEIRALTQEMEAEAQDKEGAGDASFEQQYQQLAAELKEDVRAMESLNPKMGERILKTLLEVQRKLPKAPTEKDWKSAWQALSKLRATSGKASLKVSEEEQAVADKAGYKALRERLGMKAQHVGVLHPTATAPIAEFLAKADALVGDPVPEANRKYPAATKILLQLEKFLAKTFDKSVKKADRELLDQANDAGHEVLRFEPTYRETKELLKQLDAEVPGSPQSKGMHNRLDTASNHAKHYEFDQALGLLDPLKAELQHAIPGHAKYRLKQAGVDAVLKQAVALTKPSLPKALQETFQDFRESVKEMADDLNIHAALEGLTALEGRVRLFISERQTFVEACNETSRLLDQAEGFIPDEEFARLEGEYTAALNDYDDNKPAPAYDAVTRVGAQLQNAFRQLDVETARMTGRVTGKTGEDSRESRRLRIRLNIDGLRKALPLLTTHEPKMAAKVERFIAELTEKRNQKLGTTEKELEAIIAEVNEALKRARAQLPEGHWDAPQKAPKPPPAQTLKEWTESIEQSQVLSQVKRGKKLGEGGYGGVFRLVPDDQHQGQNVPPLVIKIEPEREELGFDNEEEEPGLGIDDEARVYEQIGEHPNILKCLGVCDVGGERGLVMEAVQGKTSDQFTKKLKAQLASGKVSHAEFWSITQYTLAKTMSALVHMHDKGLAHNDIKPQNIMIDETTGEVKLIDVGTAQPLGVKAKGVDNPLFKAPERLRGDEGSTTQTDAMAAGAVTFGTLVGDRGDNFHFGNRQGMQLPFLSAVEEVIKQYGELTGDLADTAAVTTPTKDNRPSRGQPPVRRVNERGEADPQGDVLEKDLSRSGNQSAFAEFMNAVLHPDPVKRLSPKQALEHPFLRDMLLSEDQIKQVIKRSGSDNTGIEGDEADRSDIQDALNKCPGIYKAPLDNARAAASKDVDAVPLNELLKMRQELASHRIAVGGNMTKVRHAILKLEEIIGNAPLKDSPTYFQDNKDLQTLQAFAVDSKQVHRGLRKKLTALDHKIAESEDQLVESADAGELLDIKEVQQEMNQLEAQGKTLANKVTAAAAMPRYNLYGHINYLDDLHGEKVAMRVRATKERNTLKNLLAKLNQAGNADKDTIEQARKLAEHLTAHIQELNRIKQELKAARTEAERLIGETSNAVDTLEAELSGIIADIQQARDEHAKVAKEFDAKAKAPRDTVQAMQAFEKVRQEMEEVFEGFRTEFRRFGTVLDDQAKRATPLRNRLGAEAPEGLPNPLPKLNDIVKRIGEVRKTLSVS